MSDMNEYPGYPQQGYQQQPYQQQYYAQLPYQQQGYAQQPYQPNYAWGAPAPTIPVSKAKLPIAPLILMGITALLELFFFIQTLSEGYGMDGMSYIVYFLVFGSYALFIVDVALFKHEKHLFAGIALMLFGTVMLLNVLRYNYFDSLGYYLDYENYIWALIIILRIFEPVFFILGGLYYMLSKKGFKAMKLVAAILVMTAGTLQTVANIEYLSFTTVLNFFWATCYGLGLILYSPVKDRL